jgi:UDP-N-acetylglucosamine--N-acetylmuramyl-(pentapeptide) pyrophosphoryl-undecaprenol N-acetylglucosamine transferase
MAQAGAAQMLIEAEMTPEKLRELLGRLLVDGRALAQMSDNTRTLAHPDAAQRIAQIAVGLASPNP